MEEQAHQAKDGHVGDGLGEDRLQVGEGVLLPQGLPRQQRVQQRLLRRSLPLCTASPSSVCQSCAFQAPAGVGRKKY